VGNNFIECPPDSAVYTVRCDSLDAFPFEWKITPEIPMNIDFNNASVTIGFYFPNSYVLTAYFESSVGFDSVSIDIFVNDFPSEVEISSCGEFIDNCFTTCETVTTVAQAQDLTGQTGQWIVSGPVLAVRDFGFIVEVDWAGPGLGKIDYLGFCTSRSICVNILPKPVPDFETIPAAVNETITVCRDQEIFFENNSSNAFTYTWNFGDGDIADTYDATHAYQTAGNYTVILNAAGLCDCSEEKTINVVVLDAPAPTLDCINSVCPETRQRYTATTDGCSNYNWSISSNGTVIAGGENNDDFIEVIWNEGPDGFIDLTVSGCNVNYCNFTNRFRVPIITPNGPIQGDASVCSGELVHYEAPYFLGTTYNWTLSGNGTIMGDPTSNGIGVLWDDVSSVTNATVSVSYENCFLECQGQDAFGVQITPIIRLTAAREVCQNDFASASAEAGFSSGIPVSVDWEIVDESGAVVYSEAGATVVNINFNFPPGNYFWVAYNSSADYCNEEIRERITINPLPPEPIAIIGETEICPGLEYGYSIENAGTYETEWTVTDGATNTVYIGQSMTHIFGNTPPYTVGAQHINVQFPDCKSPLINIDIQNGIQAEILGLDSVCHESIHTYSNALVGGAVYDWEIIPADMGEILQTNTNEINVFWSKSGNASIRLNACNQTIDLPIYIQANPVVTVSGDFSTCGNVTTTISTNLPSLRHEWKSEDGSIASVNNTADILPGFYTVEVFDNLGCSHEIAFEIEAVPFPEVSLTTPEDDIFCDVIPGGIELVANTDGADYTFEWYQNGSLVGSGPTFLATDFASYYVKATNEFGCSADSPIADIGSCCPIDSCLADICDNPSGCGYLEHNFGILTTDNTCSAKTYTPSEPDLVPGSGRWRITSVSDPTIHFELVDILNFEYELPGYYKVIFGGKLAGYPYANANCYHNQIFIDTVRMVADFKVMTACVNEAVMFNDLTTFIPGETITNWDWNFGDPASGTANLSNDQNPNHTFAAGGTYTITLTTTASSGCTSTAIKELLVSDGPDLVVTYDLVNCVENATSFNLTGAEYEILWDFDDPSSNENSATATNVYHTYIADAIYNVSVSAEDIYGCSNTNTVAVDIKPNNLTGVIDIQPGDMICQGDTADLTAPPGATSWLWSTNETADAIKVANSDQYSVFMKDDFNCTYTTPAEFITVNPKPVVIARARIIYGNDVYGPWEDELKICDGVSFEIQAFAANSLDYLWEFGATSRILVFNLDANALPGPGVHTYTVVGTDQLTGCTADAASITIEVYALPDAPIIQLTSGSSCSFDVNTLTVTNPNPTLEYLWSNGETGTQIEVSVDGDYIVEAITSNGCTAESNVINIKASASVDRLPGGCFDLCDPFTLCLPPLSNVGSYEIYRNGTVVSSGTTWPSDYLIDQSGTYHFEVTSNNGCTAISLPLNITLYQGVGVITVQVFDDVDLDGTISAGDSLVPGIEIIVQGVSNSQTGATVTEADGAFDFVDFPTGDYLAHLDLDLLEPAWLVVIDSVIGNIATCDDSVSVALLLKRNCEVLGPTLEFKSCPGEDFVFVDSTWNDIGSYEHHFLSAAGCDSIVMVNLVLPDSGLVVFKSWMDVDDDGSVSANDSLQSNIDFIIENLGSGSTTMVMTDGSGSQVLNLPVGNYLLRFDLDSLDQTQSAIIDSLYFTVSGCDGINGLELDFLLDENCQPLMITDQASICFGDSILVAGEWLTEQDVYTFTLSDPASPCDTTLQFTLIVSPQIIITDQASICFGDSILVNDEWLSEQDVYTFVIGDPTSSCDTTLELSLTVFPELVVDAIVVNECDPSGGSGSITLLVTGEGPFTYNWDPMVSTDSIATNLLPNTYFVEVIDANNCSNSQSFQILPTGILQFNIDSFFTVEVGESVVLPITGDIDEPGLAVDWIPSNGLSCADCFSPSANPDETTIYQIVIQDDQNCEYFLQTVVEVIPSSNIFASNVFTPNQDGINDYFLLQSQDPDAKLIELQVFNRWGAMVYAENDVILNAMQGWDGTYQGSSQMAQVCVYHAKIELSDGRIEEMSGDVTIIR